MPPLSTRRGPADVQASSPACERDIGRHVFASSVERKIPTSVEAMSLLDVRAAGAQHVEVRFAEQRDRLPCPARIAGADQAQERRKIVARVGVARTEEPS
jgi:hypothetical protein